MKTKSFSALLSASLIGLLPMAALACSSENINMASSTPTSRFTLNSDGTATDMKTGLTWMRCSLGQTWDGVNNCTGSVDQYEWGNALMAADVASYASQSDWRLPNIKELASILEQRCSNPSINLTVFPSTNNMQYWTSSPSANSNTQPQVWSINFSDGLDSVSNQNNRNAVRLVRTAD